MAQRAIDPSKLKSLVFVVQVPEGDSAVHWDYGRIMSERARIEYYGHKKPPCDIKATLTEFIGMLSKSTEFGNQFVDLPKWEAHEVCYRQDCFSSTGT